MMIVIQHFQEKVILIHELSEEKHQIINEFNGKRILDCLLLLNNRFQLSKGAIKIAWIEGTERIAEKQLLKLKEATLNPLELRFFSDFTDSDKGLKLGVSYFDSPALMQYSRNVQYTTWYSSTQVGILHSNIIDWDILTNYTPKYFQAFLLILSFDLYHNGGLIISDPQLTGIGKTNANKKYNKLIDYIFLAARGTLRQKVFYFLNFPSIYNLWNFINAKPVAPYSKLDEISKYYEAKKMSNVNLPTYDVIIPTIGRATFLRDVLEDLNKQSYIPKSVIIIEQELAAQPNSQLDFLIDSTYRFEIIHKLINQLGACNARNKALDLVSSDWVFFADDDIRFNSDLCRNVLTRCVNFDIHALTIATHQKNEKIDNSNILKVWNTFGSGCSFVKYSVIENIRFDMALEFGYGEDVDFGMAIRRQGVTVYYGSFSKILHLKAPIGGFRYKHNFPWSSYRLIPKPSPTIMYNMYKNSSFLQIKGYKMYLFINQILKNPLNIFLFKKKWDLSKKWALKLGVKP